MDPPGARTFEGCIYGEQPLNPKYHLSAEQLSSLQLVGLPVCVEHEARERGCKKGKQFTTLSSCSPRELSPPARRARMRWAG